MQYQNPSLKKLEAEYEKQVEAYILIKNEWNNLIRLFYKSNMGVGLKEGNNRKQINIRIEAAPNQEFLDIIESNYPELDFEELQILTKFSKEAKIAFPYFTDKSAVKSLQKSIEYADERLKIFNLDQITKSIFPFLRPKDSDTFGTYFPNESVIVLYVFPIKIFSILRSLDDDAIFVSTMAHELAHGYNHIGLDKDNQCWQRFKETDDNIAEGLAQYYTSQFIDQYLHKKPTLRFAFDALRIFQPPAYSIFKQWDLSLEQMYAAFIDARRNEIIDYTKFEKVMKEAKKRVRRYENL